MILTLDSAIEFLQTVRAEGKIVGLCHGVFDVMHAGHIRHFKEASASVDFLVVSITADNFIKKGNGRPFFSESKRAEVLESLMYVDLVIISNQESGESVIQGIKPDFYFKGTDYRLSSNDIKLDREVSLVKEIGGITIFTNSLKFSSTSIIDSIRMPHSQEFASWVSENFNESEISSTIEVIRSFVNYRLVVIGDAIQDEYVTCESLGKSGKEALLAFEKKSSEVLEGGAISIARNLESLAAEIHLITDYPENFLAQTGQDDFASRTKMFKIKGNPSGFIRKTRFIDKVSDARLFLQYERIVQDIKPENSSKSVIDNHLRAILREVDITLISDFGHGVISNLDLQEIKEESKFIVMNAQLNAASRFPTPISSFIGSNMVILNRAELLWSYNGRESDFDEICHNVIEITGCEYLIVTLGADGLAIFFQSEKIVVPAIGTTPRDRVGAGDSLLGISALCAISGLSPKCIGVVGNIVASLNIQHLGSKYKLQISDLIVSLETLLAHVREK